MINIAIVEDEKKSAETLSEYLEIYSKKNVEDISIRQYGDALAFLDDCRDGFDIVFMDIELPHMNGMDASFELRKIDKRAILIFVTNMKQFAIRGYEVNALDFIVKPINYQAFAYKMQKAVAMFKANVDFEITINQAGGIRRISIKEISYIEVSGHKLLYHTFNETITSRGSLAELEENFKIYNYLRCNSCYLVNPNHIVLVNGQTIILRNGEKLQISYPRKKKFMEEFAAWLGKGN